MFLAPISLKSRSASYFKSFETLNLKGCAFEEVVKQGTTHLAGCVCRGKAYLPK